MAKIDVLFIHGGMTFKNKKDYLRYLRTKTISLEKRISWSGDYLERNLGKRYNLITPRMPLSDNASYWEWKIVFERYLPLLSKNFILIGNSLGGIFLAKYLSENKLKEKALSVFLVCPPFDDTIPGEDLCGGFKLKPDLSLMRKNCKKLHLLFSEDDETVPLSQAKKYERKLKDAHIEIYPNKNGHFFVFEFPEIVALIKSDVRSVA